jgi:DNA-directed RNA polymerase specialized sigma24 family protein
MNNTTDQDLMDLVSQGDRGAASEIIRRYRGSILEFCERAWKGAGEFLTTEVFLVATRLAHEYRGPNVQRWLVEIARSRLRTHREADARRVSFDRINVHGIRETAS